MFTTTPLYILYVLYDDYGLVRWPFLLCAVYLLRKKSLSQPWSLSLQCLGCKTRTQRLALWFDVFRNESAHTLHAHPQAEGRQKRGQNRRRKREAHNTTINTDIHGLLHIVVRTIQKPICHSIGYRPNTGTAYGVSGTNRTQFVAHSKAFCVCDVLRCSKLRGLLGASQLHTLSFVGLEYIR